MSGDRLLLHTCCAPCAIACVQSLAEENYDVTSFWLNPNIHPFTEHRSRRDTLISYAQSIGLPLVTQGEYGLRPFLQAIGQRFDARCGHCYALRMNATAQYAAANGFAAFSTTLLISPYQNHELLVQTAEAAAAEAGVSFLYRDFRPLFRQGQAQARALGLYMQKYCGCIFSEEDRYLPKGAKPKENVK